MLLSPGVTIAALFCTSTVGIQAGASKSVSKSPLASTAVAAAASQVIVVELMITWKEAEALVEEALAVTVVIAVIVHVVVSTVVSVVVVVSVTS